MSTIPSTTAAFPDRSGLRTQGSGQTWTGVVADHGSIHYRIWFRSLDTGGRGGWGSGLRDAPLVGGPQKVRGTHRPPRAPNGQRADDQRCLVDTVHCVTLRFVGCVGCLCVSVLVTRCDNRNSGSGKLEIV